MKKSIIVLALILSLGLSACGTNDKVDSLAKSNESMQQTTTEETTSTTVSATTIPIATTTTAIETTAKVADTTTIKPVTTNKPVTTVKPTTTQTPVTTVITSISNIATVTPVKTISQVQIDFEKYCKDNNVISAKEVQYDAPNKLDTEFALIGYATLDDYYNYGYRDLEDTYFCVYVEQLNSKGSEYWYVYFDRTQYKDLYNELLNGKRGIGLCCKVNSSRYRKGQNNMAEPTYVVVPK